MTKVEIEQIANTIWSKSHLNLDEIIGNNVKISVEIIEEAIRIGEDKLNKLKLKLQELKHSNPEKHNLYCGELSQDEVTRYSRQIIMPEIGIEGQLALKYSKILVVGAGGLGCPSSLYLAAAGIGEITIVDFDDVELTNLHRQILHTITDINKPKVQSAAAKLLNINNNIKVNPIKAHVNGKTIENLVKSNRFNVILDCTDNVATRYLLNDISIFNDIPLVSGSALRMEGQLTVYNYKNGPCYRCLFPIPPPPNTVTNCGDGGVLGVIPGVIGVLQALETIKIITGSKGVLSERLLIFDGSDMIFRNIKLRTRNLKCDVCGENPKIKNLIDYEQFCGTRAHDKVIDIDVLSTKDNVDVENVIKLRENGIILDVRPKTEFEMCHLPETLNIPFEDLVSGKAIDRAQDIVRQNKNVFVLCRRGNDSQLAVKYLQENFPDFSRNIFNINGGLYAYHRKIDKTFPIY